MSDKIKPTALQTFATLLVSSVFLVATIPKSVVHASEPKSAARPLPAAKVGVSAAGALGRRKRRRRTVSPEHYCRNIRQLASDARMLWQVEAINKMEKELESKIVLLEQKIQEHKEWLQKRNAFARKANKDLVNIYAKMRPDAAAVQLSLIDDAIAAAILTKLKPRAASSILNEMKPARAARLSGTIAASAQTQSPGRS